MNEEIKKKERLLGDIYSERETSAARVQTALDMKLDSRRKMEQADKELTEWKDNNLQYDYFYICILQNQIRYFHYRWKAEIEQLNAKEKPLREEWEMRVKQIMGEYIKVAEEYITPSILD
jgi:hypothetical protein